MKNWSFALTSFFIAALTGILGIAKPELLPVSAFAALATAFFAVKADKT